MATVLIPVSTGILPEGFCPSGEGALQEYYEKMMEITQWSLSGGVTFFNQGPVAPAPDLRVYPWFRVVNGQPDRLYLWANDGFWLAKHPLPPNFTTVAPRELTTQALVNAFDEGDSNPASLYGGPFWEIDSDFEGRVPIGPGTVSGVSNPALVLGPLDEGGSGAHTLTQLQLPLSWNAITATLTGHRYNPESLAPMALAPQGSGFVLNTNPAQEVGTFNFTNPGGGQPTPILPPYHSRYFIRRTARQFYAIPG